MGEGKKPNKRKTAPIGETKAHNEIDREKFCFYPFMQMLLQPTGTISPCCWNQEIVLGNVPKEKLAEIWNGEEIRKLRREFLSGQPVSCKTQMSHIKCHQWSRRDYTEEIELAEIQTKGPLRLDVRLNGKCNLQCVMCDVWKQPNGLYDASDFWTLGPDKIFPYLKEMDVLGGEPFVQSDTFRLINEISKVNKECTWAFVSNGQYKFGPVLRTHLDKINLRWFQISLDSVNAETYPRVRQKGVLEKTLRTIDDLCEYRKQRADEGRPFNFLISMCVQKENWREIHEFLEFADGKSISAILQFAYQPDNTSLLYLNSKERMEVLNYLFGLQAKYGNRLDPVFLPIKDSIRAENRSTSIENATL